MLAPPSTLLSNTMEFAVLKYVGLSALSDDMCHSSSIQIHSFSCLSNQHITLCHHCKIRLQETIIVMYV